MKSRINKCISNSVENYQRVLNDEILQENIENIVIKSVEAFRNDKKMLLNLNPDLPNQISEYLYYYQLVIADNSKLRERVATTWQECKSMGLSPSFIDN